MMRLIFVALCAAALAGCMDDGNEDVASEASLSFDGADDGRDSEAAFCERGGQLSGGSSVDDGAIRLSVQDGEGQTVFTQTYEEGFDLEGESFEGAEGDWVLSIDRQDGFAGEYSFTMVCS